MWVVVFTVEVVLVKRVVVVFMVVVWAEMVVLAIVVVMTWGIQCWSGPIKKVRSLRSPISTIRSGARRREMADEVSNVSHFVI